MSEIKIGVIGLGYVGLPVSVAFSEKYDVIGYDINKQRVDDLNKFHDNTLEITHKKLKNAINKGLIITERINDLKKCNFYIITVPTPINKDKSPNLSALINASTLVANLLKKGDIVVYESTVYPGCTEEVCVPVLEEVSKLKYNTDFFCGYSPERINPGDKEHTIEKIVKVTSGSTPIVSDKIDSIYSSIIKAGTFKADSIKVAEAAKVIENAQRDINIAFMNELAKIFNKMEIDTSDVLKAANTKWNFLDFKPGLVGGHCIGVDPYYLTSKAKKLGYDPQIILSGRKINDDMGTFVADEVIKLLLKKENDLKNAEILVMGVTFKENCPDFRNTKVVDIIRRLKENGLKVDIYDPWVENTHFKTEYGLLVETKIPDKKYDAIIIAVPHDNFKNIDILNHSKSSDSVIYDIKGFLNKKESTKRL